MHTGLHVISLYLFTGTPTSLQQVIIVCVFARPHLCLCQLAYTFSLVTEVILMIFFDTMVTVQTFTGCCQANNQDDYTTNPGQWKLST